MSDKYPRNRQRHRHRLHQQSVIGDIVDGVGTSLAVALQTASQVNHTLESKDNIMQAVLIGSRHIHRPNSQSYQRQNYQKQYQQQGPFSQPFVYDGSQQSLGDPPSYKSSIVSANSDSKLDCGEPPPAYDEASSTYDGPPPPYAKSSSDSRELSVDYAEDAFAFTRSPPAYQELSPACAVEILAYGESQLYNDIPGAYESPLFYGKGVPVYGYPPCYHYKYTDGCQYCLKWKWS